MIVLILRILLFVSTAISFFYGAFHYIGKKNALFKSLIVFAFGCLMLGRLNEIVTLLIRDEIPRVFHIGMLAVIGGFAFIFSASYGQMDGLVDDKSEKYRKYRFMSLIAIFVIIAIYIPIAVSGNMLLTKIIAGIQFVIIAAAAYYNFKHLIIPDVELGIIESIRGYNLVALILEILYAVQIMADCIEGEILWMAVSIAIILICPIALPVMGRGSRKWIL